MDNFVIIIALLLIGMLLKRIPAFSSETGNILNLFVIYISLPALILLKVPELEFSVDILIIAIMPWTMLVFSAGLVICASRILKWDRSTTGCLLLVVPLGNTSFLGVPMVGTFFGQDLVLYALLYDQLGSFLALATYGSLIIALYGTAGDKPSTSSVLKKIVTFPPFIALILAFCLRPFSYPAVAESLLSTLSATLIPLVMIAVGFQLKLRMDKKQVSQLSFGLLVKLVVAPLTALACCYFLGLDGIIVQIAIFEAAMPPMVSAGALAILANLSPTLTAALVGIGIVASFVTLPLLYQLLSNI